MAAFWVGMALLWIFRGVIFGVNDIVFHVLAKIYDALLKLMLMTVTVVGSVGVLILMGTPQGSTEARENLGTVHIRKNMIN